MNAVPSILKSGPSAQADASGNSRFSGHCQRLLETLELAHAAYYQAETFGGPSLYFHQKALEAASIPNLDRFAECVYATLASWGMHRMGQGGSKMCDFGPFYDSLKAGWPLVLALRSKHPKELTVADWSSLQALFGGIKCMQTATLLVGNSKVLAHALPNLVPPVDREYTLKFLYGRGHIRNNLTIEWKKLEEILRGFFYPVLASTPFQEAVRGWITQRDCFAWDTSELKVIDNLVIGLMKMNRSGDSDQATHPTHVRASR
jgi:hypothetical protein